jgi:hypothetical protein
MSRGLGKTQRDILELLENNGGSMPLCSLSFDLSFGKQSKFKDRETAYCAVSRACGALQKRGLVTKRRKNLDGVTEWGEIFSNIVIELVKR